MVLFAHSYGDRRLTPLRRGSRWIPLGRLCLLPTPPPDAQLPRLATAAMEADALLWVTVLGARLLTNRFDNLTTASQALLPPFNGFDSQDLYRA